MDDDHASALCPYGRGLRHCPKDPTGFKGCSIAARRLTAPSRPAIEGLLMRGRLQHRPLTKQPINRSLRRGLLDVLAPGREVASGGALGGLAIAGPAHAAVLQQEHLGGAAGEWV